MKPILSIIVPFYNVEEYFEDFLTSLLPINDNYEVILVNDGTKDKSRDIALKFISKYKNVVLVDKENGGLSSARNFGFNKANGEYVIFFDSDDYIENKLVISEMLQKAITTNSDIVVAPYYEFTDLNHKKYRYDRHNFKDNLQNHDEIMETLFYNTSSLAVWNKIYKKEFLEIHNLKFVEGKWFEDLDYIFRNYYVANKISKVESVLLGYRQRDGSIMQTLSPKILDKLEILDNLKCFLEKKNSYKRYEDGFKTIYIRMAFSIFFNAVTKTANYSLSQDIVKKVFDNHLFIKFKKEGISNKKYMSKLEKIIFILIKKGVINQKNIFYIKNIAKIIRG